MCQDTKIFELEKHQPSSSVSDFLTSFLSPEIYETIFNEGIDKEKNINILIITTSKSFATWQNGYNG